MTCFRSEREITDADRKKIELVSLVDDVSKTSLSVYEGCDNICIVFIYLFIILRLRCHAFFFDVIVFVRLPE